MVIVALLIQWPTILSLLMAPVLFWAYVRLARREEDEMEELFGEAYRVYQALVPACGPRRGDRRQQVEAQSQNVPCASRPQ